MSTQVETSLATFFFIAAEEDKMSDSSTALGMARACGSAKTGASGANGTPH
jgi:hypothetical protein